MRSDATGPVVSLRAASQARDGVEALRELCRTIDEIGDATCHRFGDDVDGVDYREIVEALRASLEANLRDKPAAHSEGYLRGLADLIYLHVVGVTVDPCDEASWDPITATRLAFTA